jgi:signal transduction histidine kinase
LAIVFEQKSTSPLLVEGDKSRLFETLSNLIGNAIKFTDNGTITITSDRDDSGSKAIITIKDTGKGIDPDIMPMLFTKFASKSDKGTGLGLYLAKSIIEAHGGTIWAENNNDGKGATFAFSIPILMENRI